MTKEVARECLFSFLNREVNLYRCLALLVRYTYTINENDCINRLEIPAAYRMSINGSESIPPNMLLGTCIQLHTLSCVNNGVIANLFLLS